MLYRWGTCFLIERQSKFICVRCNATYKRYQLAHCPKCIPIVQKKCKYLAEVIGEELIQCKTCCGNVRIKYPINVCSLHGTCLPTYMPSDGTLEFNNHTLCYFCPQKKLVAVS